MIRYIQNKNCEATELDDEWIVLNTEQFTVTKLNEIGGFCWSMLSEAQTIDVLVQAVEEEFETGESKEMIKKDLEEYLAELIQHGLVQYVH
jgi:hypothetical protein